MRLRWRRPGGEETDVEWVFGVLFGSLLGLALLLLHALPGRLVPPCLFRRFTTFPCPTCGAYRALEGLLSGELVKAWLLQPLAVSLVLAGAVYVGYAWAVVLFRLPRLRLEGFSHAGRRVFLAAAVLAACNWAYLILTQR